MYSFLRRFALTLLLAVAVVSVGAMSAAEALATPALVSPTSGNRTDIGTSDGYVYWLDNASHFDVGCERVVIRNLVSGAEVTVAEAGVKYAELSASDGWAMWIEYRDGQERVVAMRLGGGDRVIVDDDGLSMTGGSMLRARSGRVAWRHWEELFDSETGETKYRHRTLVARIGEWVPIVLEEGTAEYPVQVMPGATRCVLVYLTDGADYVFTVKDYSGATLRQMPLPAGYEFESEGDGDRLVLGTPDPGVSVPLRRMYGLDTSSGLVSQLTSSPSIPGAGTALELVPVGQSSVGAMASSADVDRPGTLTMAVQDAESGVFRSRIATVPGTQRIGAPSGEERLNRWCDGEWAVWSVETQSAQDDRPSDIAVYAERVTQFPVLDRPVLTSRNSSAYTLYIKKVPGVHDYRARSLVMSCVVRDQSGRPLSGRRVHLQLYRLGQWTSVAAVRSNSYGVASAKVPLMGGMRSYVLWRTVGVSKWRLAMPEEAERTFGAQARATTVRIRRGTGTLLRSEL